jgi:membrane protease YdiL (CAAX protease family)
MRYDGRIDRTDTAMIAVGLAYAAALEWRARPRDWTLLAPARAWIVPLLPALAALAAWAALRGTAPEPLPALRYLGWALLQQFMLQVIVARRLQVAGNREAATLATAALFALLHAPNTPLMLLTFAGGLLWTAWFLRRRALLPVALAHAAAALLIGGLVAPDAWLRSLEVGARYLR